MIKGGALSLFFEKRPQTTHISRLPMIQLLPLPVMMLASGQAPFSSGQRGIINLNQCGFCKISNQQQKKPSISVKKG
jgi:hypothetical protein